MRKDIFNELPVKPSHGMISLSRTQGGKHLFAAHLRSHEYVSLRITQCRRAESNGVVYYHPFDQLIDIALTSTQFADLLMSFNTSGVPCTINAIGGKGVEQDKEPPATEQRIAYNQFKETCESVAEGVKAFREAIGTVKLTKRDEQTLKAAADMVEMRIKSNMPYAVSLYQETVDKINSSAKRELIETLLQTARQLGIPSAKAEALLSE